MLNVFDAPASKKPFHFGIGFFLGKCARIELTCPFRFAKGEMYSVVLASASTV